MSRSRTLTRTVPVLAASALLSVALVTPASAQANAELRILHGIPDTPVDVYVNGERALDDFEPKTVTDNLDLPAGSYEVAVFGADAEDNSGDPVIAATLDVPASGNVSVIAHLTEDGTPTLTPYVNDTSAAADGQGRLVVSHDAAAPAVDILAGGEAVVSGLTNPDQEALDLPAGTVSASVAAAGTTEAVIGPADVPVTAGQSTIVYAIGSLEDSTLDVLVQTVPLAGGAEAPHGVPAGSGGLIDTDGAPTALYLLVGAGALAVAGGSVLVRGRRQQ